MAREPLRPELARRQRAKAEAFAAADPRLDFTEASLELLVGREETDDVLAYIGEVLLRETGGGRWTRDDGEPAIEWDLIDGERASMAFRLRGLLDADGMQRAALLLGFGREPTPATLERLFGPDAPRRAWLVAAPLVVLYVAVMVALVWWVFGPRAALVAAAFGLGYAVVRRLVQPRAR